MFYQKKQETVSFKIHVIQVKPCENAKKAHNSSNWNFSISVQKLRHFFFFSKKLSFQFFLLIFNLKGIIKKKKIGLCLIYLKFDFIYTLTPT
jgi:hypothetical protein